MDREGPVKSFARSVAVIPARGGSQSIPDKNIRDFDGKPLIAWSIETALAAVSVDRVIVSTDSSRIADVARAYGAEVPFLRPASLARADTALEPVLAHAAEWLREDQGRLPDAMILLVPTNPLREVSHIDESVRLFYEAGVDAVMTANESPAHYTPYWTVVRDALGDVRYFGGQDLRHGYTRRQDFPQQCFAKNDLVYVFRPVNLFGPQPSVYGDRTRLLVTDRVYDGDINTSEEWDLTLQTFRRLRSPGHPS
jgi:CMP-N,N'-diacetyllegionaminic acid synthase